MTEPAAPDESLHALSVDDLEELDAILDDVRERVSDDIPQWEFCDGFLTALVCMRRAVPQVEYFSVLLGDGELMEGDSEDPLPIEAYGFADAAQQQRFLSLWSRRWSEVERQLDADVQSLDDDEAFTPCTFDIRGMVAMLPPDERATAQDGPLAAYGQVWALGFMCVVEAWADDWAAPRDKETAQWLEGALELVNALTEDDTGTPAVSMVSDDAPPSLSQERLDAYAEAIWAVYDLRQLWHSLGPRHEPVVKAPTPGRNDPCWCGSGKKFKKCHGA